MSVSFPGCTGIFWDENKAPLSEGSAFLVTNLGLETQPQQELVPLFWVPAAGHSLLTLPSANHVMCVLKVYKLQKMKYTTS